MKARAAAWLLGTLALQAGAQPCGDALDARVRHSIEGDRVMLVWSAQPSPIPLDRHFALDVVVCGAPVAALRVDADMPAHRHGMNYRTSVQAAGEGRYTVRGLLFHMPGRWRLIFDLDRDGQTLRLTQEVEVR